MAQSTEGRRRMPSAWSGEVRVQPDGTAVPSSDGLRPGVFHPAAWPQTGYISGIYGCWWSSGHCFSCAAWLLCASAAVWIASKMGERRASHPMKWRSSLLTMTALSRVRSLPCSQCSALRLEGSWLWLTPPAPWASCPPLWTPSQGMRKHFAWLASLFQGAGRKHLIYHQCQKKSSCPRWRKSLPEYNTLLIDGDLFCFF